MVCILKFLFLSAQTPNNFRFADSNERNLEIAGTEPKTSQLWTDFADHWIATTAFIVFVSITIVAPSVGLERTPLIAIHPSYICLAVRTSQFLACFLTNFKNDQIEYSIAFWKGTILIK